MLNTQCCRGLHRRIEDLYFPSGCTERMLLDNLAHLSYYQTVMLRPMITDNMLPFFSLKRKDVHFQIKICGSGGGGYFLGFADDVDATNEFMKEHEFPITWVI